ncbi:hypothetical protein [Hanstruepera marina]|uniref:hypothetical protein n=1 Tax=Hanstruepera marina TaxID=2873265 RepID=UPI001CA60519|nr:hypothetical protein [Hanstruepera marina]
MKTYSTTLIIGFLILCSYSVFGQASYAKIEKNYNNRASSLSHNLNKTKDTLLLKSTRKITHIYSINSDYKREIDIYLDTNEYQLSLSGLSLGKHLLVVGESPKKIVFVLRIQQTPEMITLEKSKLSSLDD